MTTRPDGHLCRFWCFAPLLVLVILPGCPAGQSPPATGGSPAAPATVPAGGGETRAELDVACRPGSAVVTIDLRNTGKAPIKVDKDLVFLVNIRALDANGTGLECEKLRGPPRPASFADRFVTIAPGKSIRRTVDMKKGFDHFVWGYVTARDLSYHLPICHVGRCRLAAKARPAAIEVDYNAKGFMYDENFKHYTGLDLRALGLYEGPLTKKVACRTE